MTKTMQVAGWMLVAVTCFYVGDNLTKFLSDRGAPIFQMLLVRSSFSLVTVLLIIWLFKSLRADLKKYGLKSLQGKLPHLRAVVWTMTVYLFAYCFRGDDMTGVYVVSFLAPIFVIIINKLIYNINIDLITLFLVVVMFVMIIIVELSSEKGITADNFFNYKTYVGLLLAFFYGLYFKIGDVVQSYSPNPEIARTVQTGANMTFSVLVFGVPLLILMSIPEVYLSGYISLSVVDTFWIGIAGVFSSVGLLSLTKAFTLDVPANVAPFDYLIVAISVISDHFWYHKDISIWRISGVIGVLISAMLFGYFSSRTRPDQA